MASIDRGSGPAGYLAAGSSWTDDEVSFDAPDELTEAVCRTLWDLAATMRARRGATGLTVTQLAEAAGVRRQTATDILAGRSWPDLATIARLAQVLGLRVAATRAPAPQA